MNAQQFSLLSGEEIRESKLVQDFDDHLFRASTYDLSVGDIIPAGGKTCSEPTFSLEPGGTVRVVSKETLNMPETITGHVLLKNELCTKGVLAINIGVVDPGYMGPLSSTLINFGRETCVVEKGTPFLRVSFHRCQISPKAKNSRKHERSEYVSKVKQEVLAYSASTFLNMDKATKEAAAQVMGDFKQALIFWAAIAAVAVALVAMFPPIGAALVDKYLSKYENNQIQESLEKKLDARYDERIQNLSRQLDELKRESQNKTVDQTGGKKKESTH